MKRFGRAMLLPLVLATAACAGRYAADEGAASEAPSPTPRATDTTGEPGTAAATPTPCTLSAHPAFTLLYAGVGGTSTLDFLKGCPGEIIVGEKHADRPHGVMRTAAAHAAGGRTAYVYSRNGHDLADKLLRSDGVEKTKAEMLALLASGYDYIVIDEITADPMWADGATVNYRFRQLLYRMPRKKIIGYVSIDLTQYAGGGQRMRDRRYLLRALAVRGRGLAMEVYLHTGAVMAGAAQPAIKGAADRLAAATAGLSGGAGINAHAITVLGTTIHGNYPQYVYLDQPSHDLESIRRQAYWIRHASARTASQRGIGYYFVGSSDLEPRTGAPYTKEKLLSRMELESRRERRTN